MAAEAFDSLLLQLSKKPQEERLRCLALRPAIRNLALTQDLQLLLQCSPKKKIVLHKGMDSIAAILGLPKKSVKRIPTTGHNWQLLWLGEQLCDDDMYDLSQFRYMYGDMFTIDNVELAVLEKGRSSESI